MAGTSSHTCCSPSTSTYSNPVINQDFPDPNCIKVADTFYVFATNFGEMEASRSHVQLATTNDLVTYQLQPDALPKLPSWAKTGKTWAPNVTHVHTTDGSLFVLYFVARDTQSDKQAIGVATSKNPEGPYQSHDPAPVIIQVILLAEQLGAPGITCKAAKPARQTSSVICICICCPVPTHRQIQLTLHVSH